MVVSIFQEKVYEHGSSLNTDLVMTRVSISAEDAFAAMSCLAGQVAFASLHVL